MRRRKKTRKKNRNTYPPHLHLHLRHLFRQVLVRSVRARSARILNYFTLSCFNYVRRISLAHTVRKSLEKINARIQVRPLVDVCVVCFPDLCSTPKVMIIFSCIKSRSRNPYKIYALCVDYPYVVLSCHALDVDVVVTYLVYVNGSNRKALVRVDVIVDVPH